ncbi:hypothetical protein FJT64_006818 [Amphibalanus amphitrite]|uniref:Uncharacterized protein n=1 Tax=Amphibalanus amphitrite TaxID=1232801 RepID=A0A6A4VXW1_AMPAM|nr:hypothetical protein FJT64_006818 [Amphibalanus amphitrite]
MYRSWAVISSFSSESRHGVAEDEDQLVAALEEMMPAVSSADIAAAGLEDDEVKALISQIPQRWPSKLREVPPVLKPYFSPSELLHGRQLRTSLENAVVQSSDCRSDGAIQQHVRKKQRKMKRYHDRTARKPDIKVEGPSAGAGGRPVPVAPSRKAVAA